MDPRDVSDPTLSHLTEAASHASTTPTGAPPVARVVSGEGDAPYVLPSFDSLDAPRAFARPRRAIHWNVVLTVVALTGVATAGTVGGVWADRTHALTPTPALTLADSPTEAAPARFESLPAASFHAPAPFARAHRALSARASTRAAVAHAPIASPAAQPTTPESNASCTQRCGLDVQCILACPSPGGEALHGAAPASPSREQVLLAMQQVRGAVMVCGASLAQGPRTARVSVTFASGGGVADVEVGAPYGGTLPGDCIERAVRRAHVPRFTRDEFTVDYPFTVR